MWDRPASTKDGLKVFQRLLNRFACDRSALASVSNQSANFAETFFPGALAMPGTCPCIRAFRPADGSL